MNDYTPTKRCSKCHTEYPATPEYFHRHKGRSDGFSSACRECVLGHSKPPRPKTTIDGQRKCYECGLWFALTDEYFHRSGNVFIHRCKTCANRSKEQYRRSKGQPIAPRAIIANGQKCCSRCGVWYPHNAEYFNRDKHTKDGLRSHCKICSQGMSRKWNEENPEAKQRSFANWYAVSGKLYHYEYYRRRWSHIRRRQALWRDANPDKVKAQRRRVNPDKKRAVVHRRLARKMGLPFDLNDNDIQYAKIYWHGCCAVCGRQPGLWHIISLDHWIALNDIRTDNPGTVPLNMLPLCFGIGGCNNSKTDKDPYTWLEHRLGKRKAKQKLAEIEAFFQTVRKHDTHS